MYVVCIYVCRDNGKIKRKEMSKLFSCEYYQYDIVKCRGNMNFEQTDNETSSGKNNGF